MRRFAIFSMGVFVGDRMSGGAQVRTMFSIITTAPSTTMPKSSAPSDSRFAGMCRRSRQMEANSSEKEWSGPRSARRAHCPGTGTE
jgi:hypothetical protein